MTNLARLLDDTATRYPERIAVVAEDRSLSYSELRRAADRVANELRDRGIRQGDRVALTCPNLAEFTETYFGILKAGAVAVPLNISLRRREIAYQLADSEAVCYVVHTAIDAMTTARDAFDDVESCAIWFEIGAGGIDRPDTAPFTADRDDEDTAVILYTSGTTGRPKGAELRHRNLRDNALVTRDLYGIDPERPDTYLCALPLFHSFGQCCLQNGAVAFGGTLIVVRRFDAATVVDLLASQRVTIFGGVPTMYWAMLAAADHEPRLDAIRRHLRIACSGGAALPVEVHRRFRVLFGVTILEGYGLSETSSAASFALLGESPRVGSIGVPIPGVQMKLINPDWSEVQDPDAVGEIVIKGHNIMKGYYGRPQATADALRQGWFRSGDLARRDADGYYYIVDRANDMIIRGGYNVYPRELEEVLLTHPAISLAAVIGVPHQSHGEEIKAFVVLRPDHDVSVDEIQAWGREQFASYKYPRIVQIVDALPMTSTGKILKRELA
jgi:long-chain acyl-CoA synthetase